MSHMDTPGGGLRRSDSSPALPSSEPAPVDGGSAPPEPEAAGPAAPRSPGLERSRSEPNFYSQGAGAEESTQPLGSEWTIWFDKSGKKGKVKGKGGKSIYDDCIVELGSFDTVQGFWAYWESLYVQNLKDHCNLRVFKKGIKPLWEDDHNKEGGKWVVRGVPKDNRKKLWTDMVTALVQGRMGVHSACQVCGVVLSTRDGGDSMQLWVSSTTQQDTDDTTPAALKRLLFPDSDAEFTNFIFQTHRELQLPSRDRAAAAVAAGATAGAAVSPTHVASTPPAAATSPPAAPPPAMPPTQMVDHHQQLHQHHHVQALATAPHPMSPNTAAAWAGQAGMHPGMQMMGGMMMPQMVPVVMQGVGMGGMLSQFPPPGLGMMPSHPVLSSPTAPAAPPPQRVGGSSGKRSRPQQPQQQSQGAMDAEFDDSDEDLPFGDTPHQSPAIREIQERAKQIRTIRKRIRYVNFFLARQGKGRELTAPEQQRIKSLPFLQRELQLLEERQAVEVEQQKAALGVDSLDFLRKPQQPMTFNTEAERRFKTMRAIRKKIRFIHYHIERQRNGKILSAAELAKVNALPEFENKLAQLESEEEAAAAAGEGISHEALLGVDQTGVSPEAAPVSSPNAGSSVWDGSQLSPQTTPQQAMSVHELQSQIELQRRQLEEKQRHIERLIQLQQQQQPGAIPVSPIRGQQGTGLHGAVSPGPPPLGSPSMGPQQIPVSAVPLQQ
eukprot:Hpha_TRINITY_DN15482_c6_g1::TRINITY_DN15482_c6_g1_i1::g.172713::m.172713